MPSSPLVRPGVASIAKRPSLAPGRVARPLALGRYELLEPIASGAMGTVYRARQQPLGRPVAVKVLHRHLADQTHVLSAFLREARAGSVVTHPNVVQVLDFGRDVDGRCMMVMELVEGHSLEEILTDLPLPPLDWTVRVMAQILAAVAAAHDAGVVHRDIKPSNVMILNAKSDEGRRQELVKVCDFGIARVPRSSAAGPRTREATLEGIVCGTAEYMSPEQAMAISVDLRTDIYSCGVILFEMATGRLPFESDSAVRLSLAHAQQSPPRPREIRPEVDRRLEAIILKALSKRRRDRYQSAREMRAALLALLERRRERRVAPPPPPRPLQVDAPSGAIGSRRRRDSLAAALRSSRRRTNLWRAAALIALGSAVVLGWVTLYVG